MVINLIKDEKGLFVFGPLWFVVLVVIIAFVIGLFKQNTPNRSVNQYNDYKPLDNTINSNICPMCKKSNLGNAKFCVSCGHPISNSELLCNECGAENPFGSNFCQNCGNKL